MSITTEIQRLHTNIGSIRETTDSILDAIANTGLVVPANSKLSDVPSFITQLAIPLTEASADEIDLMFAYPNSVVIGGRRYRTVTIGNQEWMAENLDYKFAYNGSTLPLNSNDVEVTPAAWYYDRDESTYGEYGLNHGLLYNWYAVKYLNDNRNTLLPQGWHVPTESEFSTLTEYVNGESWQDISGIKLKSTTGWYNDGNGDGSYEFDLRPAGVMSPEADRVDFVSLTVVGHMWGIDEYSSDTSSAFVLECVSSIDGTQPGYMPKTYGMTLRLVKTIE